MKEKYFEDLGLDDGFDILNKFKINIEDILEEAENHDNNNNKNNKKEEI